VWSSRKCGIIPTTFTAAAQAVGGFFMGQAKLA